MKAMTLVGFAMTLAACSSSSSVAQDYDPNRGVPAYGGRLRVPQGFAVADFAQVRGGRFMTLGPDGSVYVSQPGDGTVTRLVDANGDGAAESTMVAVSGLNRPHGLAFHKGYLYIANTNGVVRVALDAKGIPTGSPQAVNSYEGGSGHITRTIVFGPDSGMYVSIGSSCNICEESNPQRATVMRFDENGSNGRVFSKGLRNAVGMAVDPATNELWVSQHERDNLQPDHQNLPADEINILRDGGDYGWPYCHDDREPNPEFNDRARCASTIPPALRMQAHSAPLGITFLAKATNLPDDWRGDAVLAFHGSWNRDVPTGAKVVRIRIRDNRPVAAEDFITGWQTADGNRWGRPVDILVYKDGSLLVSDDFAGKIYHVWRAAGAGGKAGATGR